MSKRHVPALAVLALLAAGCSPPAPATAPQPPPPPADAGFTATLTSSTNIVLRWRDDSAGVDGRMVEFATAPDGPYTTLHYLPPGQTSYTHPDLMPETPFYYRLRPYSGPVTGPLEVGAATGATADDPAAPGDARAAILDSNDNVKFTWADRAQGEAGYLVEIRRPGAAEFAPVAVADPGSTSCVLAELPEEHGGAYRIRTVFYGQLSPVVHQTTGKE